MHGHIDKSAFKGQILSGLHGRRFDTDYTVEEVINAKVRHGWVISLAGDLERCGWDTTMYFCDSEPTVIDNTWWGDKDHNIRYYDKDGNDVVGATVVDGPHKATWLELVSDGE